jgi:hypothetical protein
MLSILEQLRDVVPRAHRHRVIRREAPQWQQSTFV